MSGIRLVAIALVLSSCSATRPEQINLVLETRPDRPRSIDEIVVGVAREANMRVTKQTLHFGKAPATPAFLIHDGSISISIQKALENCPGPEVSFDPCFSASDYRVSIYRTPSLWSHGSLKRVAQMFVKEAQKLGGHAYLDPGAVNDV